MTEITEDDIIECEGRYAKTIFPYDNVTIIQGKVKQQILQALQELQKPINIVHNENLNLKAKLDDALRMLSLKEGHRLQLKAENEELKKKADLYDARCYMDENRKGSQSAPKPHSPQIRSVIEVIAELRNQIKDLQQKATQGQRLIELCEKIDWIALVGYLVNDEITLNAVRVTKNARVLDYLKEIQQLLNQSKSEAK